MNPYDNAFRHLVASQRDRYERANQFRCHRMTARDSGPNNNESGERHRAPNHTTAMAEQMVEDRILCPDQKRKLDSAPTVESDSIPSVRPVTHCEGDARLPHVLSEVRPTMPVEQNSNDDQASRGTS